MRNPYQALRHAINTWLRRATPVPGATHRLSADARDPFVDAVMGGRWQSEPEHNPTVERLIIRDNSTFHWRDGIAYCTTCGAPVLSCGCGMSMIIE